jgi:hypothetical protein
LKAFTIIQKLKEPSHDEAVKNIYLLKACLRTAANTYLIEKVFPEEVRVGNGNLQGYSFMRVIQIHAFREFYNEFHLNDPFISYIKDRLFSLRDNPEEYVKHETILNESDYLKNLDESFLESFQRDLETQQQNLKKLIIRAGLFEQNEKNDYINDLIDMLVKQFEAYKGIYEKPDQGLCLSKSTYSSITQRNYSKLTGKSHFQTMMVL